MQETEGKLQEPAKADACVQHVTECSCNLAVIVKKERQERRLLEEELAELKRRSRSLSSILPNCFYVLDLSPFIPADNQSNRPHPCGSYGYCQRFTFRQSDVCMKFFHKQGGLSDNDHKDLVLTEAVALLNIRAHKGIPHFYGVYLIDQQYRLITSFHGINKKSTTIKYILDRPDIFKFQVGDWLQVIGSIVNALSNIHLSLYINGDVKCDSVIVEEDKTAVIIDFSKSKQISKCCATKKKPLDKVKKYRAKYPWIAPEVASGSGKPSYASDVYSLGYLILKIDKHADLQNETIKRLIEGCMEDLPQDRLTLTTVQAILSE